MKLRRFICLILLISMSDWLPRSRTSEYARRVVDRFQLWIREDQSECGSGCTSRKIAGADVGVDAARTGVDRFARLVCEGYSGGQAIQCHGNRSSNGCRAVVLH